MHDFWITKVNLYEIRVISQIHPKRMDKIREINVLATKFIEEEALRENVQFFINYFNFSVIPVMITVLGSWLLQQCVLFMDYDISLQDTVLNTPTSSFWVCDIFFQHTRLSAKFRNQSWNKNILILQEYLVPIAAPGC